MRPRINIQTGELVASSNKNTFTKLKTNNIQYLYFQKGFGVKVIRTITSLKS